MERLEHKADSQDLIGQAKGVLMERHDLDAGAALQVLTQASQEADLRLVEVARQVAARN